ncbi:MAG: OmpA family protein [Lewinellaceae bacterium]|nr:OmpA family protein [Lewinellaceae bacterium]
MKTTPCFLLIAILTTGLHSLSAQTKAEGYAFEEFNRGFLQQVKITLLEQPGNVVRAELQTDAEGYFSTSLAPGEYRLVAVKDIFYNWEEHITVGKEKVFLKIEMRRKPGYLFDVTIAEARTNPELVVDAVEGATIEIYNRTLRRSELVLKQYPHAFFQHTFEQGNHYTMMVRKPGFLAKRIEVYVNIKGCILCVDGVRSLSPGVTENLTAKNTMGTLLSNIELERVKIDKRIQVQHIYYDFDKWDIRPDAAERLDHVVTLMNDNPGMSVELGSHTDSRGDDPYNMELSHKRALSAVAYIVGEGVDSARISARGYGESQLANRCRNGIECSEDEHQQNRRTELRITGISGDSLEYLRWPSLQQIVEEEELAKTNKAKKAGQKHPVKSLPEANNSVPLPELKTDAQPDRVADDIPAPRLASGDNTGRLRELAKNYSGFVVEIACTDSLPVAADSLFNGFREVHWQKDKAGKYCLFAGNFNTPAKGRSYFEKTVLTSHPTARLVRFNKGKKTYLK